MDESELNTFTQEKECDYKNEHYSVRDNGAVLRHSRPGKRTRPLDDKWTFGNIHPTTGYAMLSNIQIHRIVATAFHGLPPNGKYVVDHIDTNKLNNRPENLRWLTQLENILLNPYTRKKIEFYCGSVENFLKNPSLLPRDISEHNFSWMRRVSKEEAMTCLKNLQKWASKPNSFSKQGHLGEWIFRHKYTVTKNSNNPYTPSLTPNAIQDNKWKISTEFLFCPAKITTPYPVLEYLNNIQFGKLCLKNEKYQAIAVSATISLDKHFLWVVTENLDEGKKYGVFRVTYVNSLFLHTSLGTFFERRGTEKRICQECGQKWYGPDDIDDYC